MSVDVEVKKSFIDTVNSFRAQYVSNSKMKKLVDAYRETIISLLNSQDTNSDNSMFNEINSQMTTIIENMCVLSERTSASRRKFKRGEAVHIISYDESMRKSYEWKHVSIKDKNGTIISKEPQLKLWEPYEFKSTSSYGSYTWNSTTRRTVRDNNGKIVSFPPGKIGFIDLDYSQKTLRTTTNIRVTFDGYVGYTDYRNLHVHDYSLDPLPEDA